MFLCVSVPVNYVCPMPLVRGFGFGMNASHLFPGYTGHYPLDGEAEVLEDLKKPVQGV